MNQTSPQHYRPRRSADRRRRFHTHAWTSAATLAALAYTVIETAGARNP